MKLVDGTGEALSRIVARVIEIGGVISTIAASTGEQAASLAEVNSAVNQMDQFTQRNAAMVQESAAASQALAEDATTLNREIGQFKVQPSEARGSMAA